MNIFCTLRAGFYYRLTLKGVNLRLISMKNKFFIKLFILFFCLLYIGCNLISGEKKHNQQKNAQNFPAKSQLTTQSNPLSEISKNMPKKQKKALQTIKVGKETVRVEIADTPLKLQRGLSFRKELPQGQGMLFIFNKEQQLSFWMKNTFIPLSIGFFDKNKRLLNILQMTPVKPGQNNGNLQLYRSQGPAMYALEVPVGWFKQKDIGPGAQLKLNLE